MDRRAFIGSLAGGLLSAPLAAEAQPAGKVYRIGYLSSASASPPTDLEPFRRGLRELGYVEGRNVLIEARFAEHKLDRLLELATELVWLKVDVIVTFSTPAAKAANQTTKTIPIVMSSGGDPVGSGLVASLAHPGGNVTGLTHLAGPEMWEKVLEFLKEIAPKVSRVGVLMNSTIPLEARGFEVLRERARGRGLNLLPAECRAADEFPRAFDTMIRDNAADAVVASESPLNVEHRRSIAEYAIQRRLPTAFGHRAFVEAGGLMSYGTSFASLSHQAATYVDKILKGAKPADLPIEQATKFEPVINLKTAKALGLTIPPSLLLRADQVIE
jgi:putative tryptophan/tyrosine transport system substrate-binding protein